MKGKEDTLPEEFMYDFITCCIKDASFLDTALSCMKPNYIPNEGLRIIWKAITRARKDKDVKTRQITIGLIKMKLRDSDEKKKTKEAFEELRDRDDLPAPDYTSTIAVLEEYIKQSMFVDMYDKLADSYNDDKEKGYQFFLQSAEEFSNFSLGDATHESIFGDFMDRMSDRYNLEDEERPIRHGILPLDMYMDGGGRRGEITMFMGDSGVGKSQLLINCGVQAAIDGFNVAHFQAEGTKKQVVDRYDANWTGVSYRNMKKGDIDDSTWKKIGSTLGKLQAKGEIYIQSYEQFGSANLGNVRNSLIEMIKLYGSIDVVILDYFELFEPADGRRYSASEERFRQGAIGKILKNLAMEFNCYIITATQASAINPELMRQENFVITRYNLSEDKGKIRPFDNFITINQTPDERQDNRVRLYNDKFRENQAGQTYPIATNLARARFYSSSRTLDLLEDADIDVWNIGKYNRNQNQKPKNIKEIEEESEKVSRALIANQDDDEDRVK